MEPKGSNGFGYDPLFVVAGQNCTMAELAPEVKNCISHRAKALNEAVSLLDALRKKAASGN
jgi:XTP/dITP diphosphohydrolase